MRWTSTPHSQEELLTSAKYIATTADISDTLLATANNSIKEKTGDEVEEKAEDIEEDNDLGEETTKVTLPPMHPMSESHNGTVIQAHHNRDLFQILNQRHHSLTSKHFALC